MAEVCRSGGACQPPGRDRTSGKQTDTSVDGTYLLKNTKKIDRFAIIIFFVGFLLAVF